MNPDYQNLLQQAHLVRAYAYAPYSDYKVGAALLSSDGNVYLGVNVENASYGATLCAERAAFAAAIAKGARKFTALAVVGNRPDCIPCGICLQWMSEFVGPEFPIVTEEGVYRLGELLPKGFQL